MLRNCRNYLLATVSAIAIGLPGCVHSRAPEARPAFLDPKLPMEQRAKDLVGRMTLEEKAAQMMENAPAIPRLKIPAYVWWNEALHGVARAGVATVFPQAVGLAATWDTQLMHEVAVAISDEARAKHHLAARRGPTWYYQGLTFWSPNINIFRDPRWGRGQETYGEDPLLTGAMGVEFVRGLQGDDPRYVKVIATAKHLAVHSGPESLRHGFDAKVDDRDLRETYLPAFRQLVREGHVASVMCAYNRVRGLPACGSDYLLNEVLRREWGFTGYVVSDCGAIDDIYLGHHTKQTVAEAAALGVSAGCELNCGTATFNAKHREPYLELGQAVRQGLIAESALSSAVERLMLARFKLGMFDPPELVPYTRLSPQVINSPQHRQLALRAARESIVLLKNDGKTLPLSKSIKSLAVIGPNADDLDVLVGNYNGSPNHPVTVLQGLRDKLGAYTQIRSPGGFPLAEGIPSFTTVPSEALFTSEGGRRQSGLRGEYFRARFAGAPILTRVDPRIDFNWHMDSPAAGLDQESFSVRWTGELVAAQTGDFELGGFGLTGYDLYLDDQLLVKSERFHEPLIASKRVQLVAGKAYRIKIEYYHQHHDAHFKLLWAMPGQRPMEAALEAARASDATVLVLGLSPRVEGEEMPISVKGFRGGDRDTLDLPEIQQRLMEQVVAMGKPVVLVLMSGGALSVNWAQQHVPAILQVWYPGEAGGSAVADVLFGDYNPSGRLPVTFYRSVTDLPAFEDYSMKERTYRYFSGEPLYPFGHGLSYTRFKYDHLVVPEQAPIDRPLEVSVDVTNVGSVAGEEVIELYLAHRDAPVAVPLRALKGFRRIALAIGQKQTVHFTLTPRDFSLIDDESKRVVLPGRFELALGGKQPKTRGAVSADTTEVVTAAVSLSGPKLVLEH